jgi:hypothetical protein
MDQTQDRALANDDEKDFASVLSQLMDAVGERADLPQHVELFQAAPTQWPYRLFYAGEKDYVGGVLIVQ